MKYAPVLILLSACCIPPRVDEAETLARVARHADDVYDEIFDMLTRLPVEMDDVTQVGWAPPASMESLKESLQRHLGCMESHSENLANITTAGYKARDDHGRRRRQWTQGALEVTERQFDLAIDGEGFFRLTLPDGRIAYTRDGSFNVDAEGNLVSSMGYLTDPQFTIPANALGIRVDADGKVLALMSGAPLQLGQLTLTRFISNDGLEPISDALFVAADEAGDPIDGVPADRAQGFGSIRQGFLEESNVDMVSEQIDLMCDGRAAKLILRLIERLK